MDSQHNLFICFWYGVSFPQGILREFLCLLLTLLQEANLYELLCILFPAWDGIGLILLLSLILQRILCFIPVRVKILRYSLKRNIRRGHVLKMNYLHDSVIGFLSLRVCFCLRMNKWSTFPLWSSFLFLDRTIWTHILVKINGILYKIIKETLRYFILNCNL